MTVQACMGGWCRKRAICANYHAADRSEPAERICAPGHDGEGLEHPVRLHRPAGSWEREPGLMAMAGVWDALG